MNKVMLILAWTASSIVLQAQEKQTAKRPNIILIMADDLGIEAMTTYGGESYQTPHLDKLAAEGMQFENCYATPLCTPSRVQLMTGKYNFRNYIGFGLLDAKEKTFAHAMKQAGYKTCIAGKWQLYGNKKHQELAGGRVGTLPLDAGFDTYRLFQVKDHGSRFKSPLLETHKDGLKTHEEEYGPDKFVEFIEDFITKNKDEPFFVYYPMVLVHVPFVPTPDSPNFKAYNEKKRLNDTTYFPDMMTYMDKQVGRIAKKLDDLKIRKNTVILFIGDNGTDRKISSTWKGQRIKGMKGYTVEAGTHVPFIAHWKGTIKPGQKNTNLVDLTDFAPSILDIAGAPSDDRNFVDGVSFYPQLLGRQSKGREWVFCSYAPNWDGYKHRTYAQNTEWKLYTNGEFYHFKSDPLEKQPIAKSALNDAQKQIRAELQQVLDRMR